MNRKVVELGKNCLVVSLPIKWARNNDISKGDSLEIAEIEGRLLLEPAKKTNKEVKEAELDLTHTPDDLVRTEIGFVYAQGWDRIRLKCNEEQHALIKDAVQNVILGFDISEKKENSLVIDEVTAPEDDKKDAILRRAFLTTNESLETLRRDLESNKYDNTSFFMEQAQRVTVFTNFCQRSVERNRFAAEKIKQHNTLYEILRLIENDIFHLYTALSRHRMGKSSPKTADIAKKISIFYKRMHEGFLTKDIAQLEVAAHDAMSYRYDVIDKELVKASGTDVLALHYLSEICWLISIADKTAINIHLF